MAVTSWLRENDNSGELGGDGGEQLGSLSDLSRFDGDSLESLGDLGRFVANSVAVMVVSLVALATVTGGVAVNTGSSGTVLPGRDAAAVADVNSDDSLSSSCGCTTFCTISTISGMSMCVGVRGGSLTGALVMAAVATAEAAGNDDEE